MRPNRRNRLLAPAWSARPSRTCGATLAAISLALLLVLGARALPGQVVRGTVVHAGDSTPLPQTVVWLLDSAGVEVVGTWSDSSGRFALHAPRAGVYRVRAQRIGFRSTLSSPVALDAGAIRELTLEVNELPVQLDAVQVQRSSQCVVRPSEGEVAATLWEEVRKALSATALTAHTRGMGAEIERFQRELLPGSDNALRDQRQRFTAAWEQPFVSVSPDTLAKYGFIRSVKDSLAYFAPDAETLLAPSFLEKHCLRARSADRHHRGMIGLAFEPAQNGLTPDIAGVLWLDLKTAELRTLEYAYTRMPSGVPESAAGGELEFQQLPSGKWIVRRWVIHMPNVVVTRPGHGSHPVWPDPDAQVKLRSVTESGGVVLRTFPLTGAASDSALMPGALTGMVIDSLGGDPRPPIEVALIGTAYRTAIDSAGRFTFVGVPPGQYDLTVVHPWLSRARFAAPHRRVRIHPGSVDSAVVTIPSAASIAEEQCARILLSRGYGAVTGVLRTSDGTALSLARVTIAWPSREQGEPGGPRPSGHRSTITGADGRFTICGVAADSALESRVLIRGHQLVAQPVVVESGAMSFVELSVDVRDDR
ncbi:MAG TPA: carboxypeptidase-like regulatory domain-containing protein [Gemmatimonadaceae bacterium]|nr:carboxypeptidase-like regulatory domain-containing protein [Gemmatimonadaceae bacterium]